MAEERIIGLPKAGMKDLLKSGLYADIAVYCNDGSAFNLHKSVICAQSPYFKSVVDPYNTESSYSSAIKLENDDPAAVKALVEYMYTQDYAVSRPKDRSALFLFHVKACAIGETYGVKGLKNLAIDRAEIVYENAASLEEVGIPLAIKTIYDMDVATDSGLREFIVDLSRLNIQSLLTMREFSEVMDEVGLFGNDLVRAMANTPPPADSPSTSQRDLALCSSTSGIQISQVPALSLLGKVEAGSPFSESPTTSGAFAMVTPGSLGAPTYSAPQSSLPSEQALALFHLLPFDVQGPPHGLDRSIHADPSTTKSIESLVSQAPTNGAASSISNTLKDVTSPLSLGNTEEPGWLTAPQTKLTGLPFGPAAFQPYIEWDNASAQHAHFQSIPFMQAYQDFSFEELRLADYLDRSAMPSSSTFGSTNAACSSNSGAIGGFGSMKTPSTTTAPSGSTGVFSRGRVMASSNSPTAISNNNASLNSFGTRPSNTDKALSGGTGGFGSSRGLFGSGNSSREGFFGDRRTGSGHKPPNTKVSSSLHSSAAPNVPEQPRKEPDHNASSSAADSHVASHRKRSRRRNRKGNAD